MSDCDYRIRSIDLRPGESRSTSLTDRVRHDLDAIPTEMGRRARMLDLPLVFRVLLLCDELLGMVDYGGFRYYFAAEAAGFIPETLDGLERIGATPYRQILDRAVKRFPGGLPAQSLEARRRQLRVLRKRWFVCNPFSTEDARFYELHNTSRPLSLLIDEFVIRNANVFFLDLGADILE
jgi:hypothetical protein